jgi:hypothetical protein
MTARLQYALSALFIALFTLVSLHAHRLETRIKVLEAAQPILHEVPDSPGNLSPSHVRYVMGRVKELRPERMPDPFRATAVYNGMRYTGRNADEATKAAAEVK